jgi:hypothetical protein
MSYSKNSFDSNPIIEIIKLKESVTISTRRASRGRGGQASETPS